MVQLRRTAANATAYDLDCELITPERAQELWPPMQVDDVLGAIWLPGDGKVNPTDLTQSLAKGARMGGALVREQVRVTGFDVDRSGRSPRVTTVRTDQRRRRVRGRRQLRRAVGARRRPDARHHGAAALGRALLRRHRGGRGHPPRPADHARPGRLDVLQGGGRRPGGRRLRARGQALAGPRRPAPPVRVPAARGGLGALLGADGRGAASGSRRWPRPGSGSSTTARSRSPRTTSSCSGRTPEVENCFIGAGFNSVGIASAGGAGRALAEWIVDGRADGDLVGVDVRRFAPFNGDRSVPARPRRRDPRAALRAARGPTASPRPRATSGSHRCTSGWRAGARSSAPATAGSGRSSSAASLDYSWDRPSWLAASAAEQRACRTGVAVFDQTSFSKYVVTGPDALAALQWVCAADVDVPVGSRRLHPVAQRAGHLRGRRDRHPGRTGLLLGRLVLGHHRARPRLAAPPDRGRGRRTSPTTTPSSA